MSYLDLARAGPARRRRGADRTFLIMRSNAAPPLLRHVTEMGSSGTACGQGLRVLCARRAWSTTPLVLSLNRAMWSLTWYLAAIASALVPA